MPSLRVDVQGLFPTCPEIRHKRGILSTFGG